MRIRLAVIAIATACQPRSATTSFDYVTPPAGGDGRVGLGALDRELASSLRSSYEKHVDESPIALVPTDGSQLGLAALDAKVTIEGPLAHTELHFKFTNTETRIREGRFSIALPVGAAVDRFAMKIGDTWREARIVSRSQGRQVYETYLHRKVDPALLEQDLGNRFSARVFPIAASADKEIIIGYDHAVSAARPYVLALHGLPAIPSLRVTLDHDGSHRQLGNNRVLPDDIVEAIDAGTTALSSGDAFVARLAPAIAAAPDPLEHVLILVDTSASRAPLMAKQVGVVHAIAAAVHGDVTIAAFDHGIDEIYRGPADAATPDKLLDHGALGASDLGKALGYAASAGAARVVLVGDGTPTLGDSDPATLASIVSSIGRIDAVQVGDNIDADVLRPIVAGGRHPGAILDGRDPARAIAQLGLAIPAEQPIVVDGATETWPATTRGIAPNEPIWVFGHRTADGPLAIHIGGEQVSITAHPGTASRIRRAVASTELAALTDRLAAATDDAARTKLGADIERIALANNLVSARTSLLVLESDADEARMLGPKPADVADPVETSFSGTTSLENQYVVDGINTTDAKGESSSGGEMIEITGAAPSIDQASTSMGVTISDSYTSNIPTGRTFSGVVGAAAGTQADTFGVPTLERYSVDDR
ncbi:MAG TPA: VIT domain-containing protein, partial [Kofleriaceae bacterium]|nr:VIT domain-containing protein [Kofleriaceae bacterium]